MEGTEHNAQNGACCRSPPVPPPEDMFRHKQYRIFCLRITNHIAVAFACDFFLDLVSLSANVST